MSSQIEGTRSNLDQLLTYEATRGAGGASADLRITQYYVEVLELGLSRIREGGRTALDLALIHKLRASLMRDETVHLPIGSYRTNQAWIGSSIQIEDATFVPAPPAFMQIASR